MAVTVSGVLRSSVQRGLVESRGSVTCRLAESRCSDPRVLLRRSQTSVYVGEGFGGRDAGKSLLHKQVTTADEADLWILQTVVFPENRASIALHHSLLGQASDADLRRKSDGTLWNNRQLLFHMLLGFLIIRALLTLVRLFDRLPVRAAGGSPACSTRGPSRSTS